MLSPLHNSLRGDKTGFPKSAKFLLVKVRDVLMPKSEWSEKHILNIWKKRMLTFGHVSIAGL
jgi:hypothetical protein